MSRIIGGATRLYGVIGWPVTTSLSPAIHNAAADALGIDLAYVALPVEPGEVERALGGLAPLGFAGVNVTMPHKTEVASLVTTLSDDARRLGAVNTVIVGDGLDGHNTDAPGFDRMLRDDEGFDPSGADVLLYGAGGAARACSLALARGGARRLTVVLRDPSRVDAVAAAVDGFGVELRTVSFDDAPRGSADLLINATPLGGHGEDLPTPPLAGGMLVIDLLTYPALTPLVVRAREAGASASGGLGLLLHQAALSFELWTGQLPPLDAMSAAAVAAMAERS